MRRSLVLFVVLALVGLALVAAGDHHRERRDGDRRGHRDRDHGERHHKGKKDKSGCSDVVGDFYRRHVQCRQCVAGADGKPQKWCATAGATTDKQGKCVDAHATCAAGTTSITSVARCPSDAPSTKHTCSLCTLDGYAWCQDELALDDEYSGECVAMSNRRASDNGNDAFAPPSDSDSGSGDSGSGDSGSGDSDGVDAAAADFLPRTQGEENLSDFSDFRGDEERDHHHHRRGDDHHRRRGDDSDDSDDSDASDASEGGESSEGSDAAEAAKAAEALNLATAKCPAGKRAVTKFASCSSAVSLASSSSKHHGGRKWMRHLAFAAVPLSIAVVLAVLLRKRCKRRCAEWRAQRAARRAARAAGNGLVIVPGTSLSAVPATRAAVPASHVAIATAMPVSYPVHLQQQPVAQPLLYSHNMGSSAPAMYQPVEGAAVEMHAMPAEASMYPGLAVGGRGYARLGQDAV